MDKLFISIVLITALIAGYIVYDTSKDVGLEIDSQSQTASAIWNKTKIDTSSTTTKPTKEDTNTPNKPTSNVRPNGNYVLVEVNGKKVDGQDKYTLLVTDSKISGRLCNSFSGGYQQEGNFLIVDSLVSTKMACVGEAGDLENILFSALRSKSVFKNEGDKMTLTSGANVLTFNHVYE